jgi:hypothetical protein
VNQNTSVHLNFSFERTMPVTELITLPAFYFSFFDLDHTIDRLAVESLQVSGYTSFGLTTPTDVAVDGNTFSSTVHGSGSDNPTDPLALTDEQRRRSVVFMFENTASFAVTMSAAFHSSGAGRNFLFNGDSNVADCVPPPSPPPPSSASTLTAAKGGGDRHVLQPA